MHLSKCSQLQSTTGRQHVTLSIESKVLELFTIIVDDTLR